MPTIFSLLIRERNYVGAEGGHSSGPASGLVRWELCCVKAFWLLFGLKK